MSAKVGKALIVSRHLLASGEFRVALTASAHFLASGALKKALILTSRCLIDGHAADQAI
jgi:hypothetical protein